MTSCRGDVEEKKLDWKSNRRENGSMKTTISQIPHGPKAAGPYSLGVIAEGKFLFVSGQGPFDSQTGKYERGTIEEQTQLTLSNIQKIVEAAGAKLEDVVSCRVFLQPLDSSTFSRMNQVYEKFWGSHPPARTTIGCQLLNMDVEIDCIVAIN